MRMIQIVLASAAILATQSILAANEDVSVSNGKACTTVANACLQAGYTRGDENEGKKFWNDCMKPIILGKAVTGVNVDAATGKSCRKEKIEELKAELKEFQAKK